MNYHYSNYWGCWSRRLFSETPFGPFIDLNLTPIRGRWNDEKEWKRDVASIVVRFHGTCSNLGDIETDNLPLEVIERMREFLEEESITFLLEGDILSMIDRDKLENHPSGGALLSNVLRNEMGK